MADIHKALEVLAREKTPRRLTWVQGLPAMREFYVVEFARRCEQTRYVWLTKDASPLWDALGEVEISGRWLGVVVRGADVLTDADAVRLSSWALSRRVRAMSALMVSDREDWPTEGWGKNAPYKHEALRELFANPRKSSLLVEGKMADSDIGREKTHTLIRYWAGCNRTEARMIATVCDYDLTHIFEVCRKARVIGSFAEAHVKVLAQRQAHSGYVEALVACSKDVAASEAPHVSPSAYGAVVARLDYALDVMARIHRTQHHHESTHALASRMGIHRTVVTRYRGFAKHYTSTAVARRTAALVWAEEQIRAGRREGVLEMLAVQW